MLGSRDPNRSCAKKYQIVVLTSRVEYLGTNIIYKQEVDQIRSIFKQHRPGISKFLIKGKELAKTANS